MMHRRWYDPWHGMMDYNDFLGSNCGTSACTPCLDAAGGVYVGTDNGTVVGMVVNASGLFMGPGYWELRLQGGIRCAPVIGLSETLYVATDSGILAAISSNPQQPADRDGDGLPDSWEVRYWGAITNSAGGPSDFDSDGATDAEECAAGTDPTDSLSCLIITALSGEVASGTVLQWSSASNRHYALRSGTNLVEGLARTEASNLPSTPPLNSYTSAVPADAAVYYRVVVGP